MKRPAALDGGAKRWGKKDDEMEERGQERVERREKKEMREAKRKLLCHLPDELLCELFCHLPDGGVFRKNFYAAFPN